ncbi:MAG: YfiR family protein [Proteobacteria bacterium]|nr:YfiR family protein [Pseudomonadota bacterium]
MKRWRTSRKLGLVCLGISGLVVLAFARQASAVSEQELKAAFLFNFARFIEWPRDAFLSADAPFTIGVLRDDEFHAVIEEVVDGKKVRGRSVAVTHVGQPEEARGAHILFVPASQRAATPGVIEALEGSYVLTVADDENFSRRGGMVSFRRYDKKLRFDINETEARRSGLKISARLLALASQVR